MPNFLVGDSPNRSVFKCEYVGKYMAEKGTTEYQTVVSHRVGALVDSIKKKTSGTHHHEADRH
jgi:hypothetical protein